MTKAIGRGESSGAGTAERMEAPRTAEALRNLVRRINPARVTMPGLAEPSPASHRDVAPDDAQFVTRSYRDQAGSLAYQPYIPSRYRRDQTVPLVVMLHGCKQSPDDFAAGTRPSYQTANPLAHFAAVPPAATALAQISNCPLKSSENLH